MACTKRLTRLMCDVHSGKGSKARIKTRIISAKSSKLEPFKNTRIVPTLNITLRRIINFLNPTILDTMNNHNWHTPLNSPVIEDGVHAKRRFHKKWCFIATASVGALIVVILLAGLVRFLVRKRHLVDHFQHKY